MKKALVLVIIFALCLAFSGCGESVQEVAPAAAVPTAASAPATEAPAAAEEPAAEPEEAADPLAEIKELVLSMKGEPIDGLLAIIGEPLSRDYGSSCLVQGGKDGVLSYDGYTVYTLVSADGEETVYDIE